jgi:hypothetical protein
MKDIEAVRQQALQLFSGFDELDNPEALVMPILLDAIAIVEAYRRARHQVIHLPELTRSVDLLLRELEIIARTNEWAKDEGT